MKSIFFDKDLLLSRAYLDLTGISPQVLSLFLIRRKLSKIGRKGKETWDIINNGEIVFPYSQAEIKYGITKPRFRRAINQLIEHGFLEINHHGGGMVKDCTTYIISDRWRKYGTDKFIFKSLPKDTRKLGFTSQNWEKRSRKKKRNRSNTGNDNVTRSSNTNIT